MGDFLKNIFKKAFIILFCGVLFLGGSYAYLYLNFNKPVTDVEQKEYNVPYERKPENCGIAFVFPETSAVLVYLDFENMGLRLLDIENFKPRAEYHGYTADYTVETDYEFIKGIIDRVGGVNLQTDDDTMRYTGTQIVELISTGKGKSIKKDLILQIFAQIEKNNFSKDDFIYIIENSKSNLSLVDCIYWSEYIGEMCKKTDFVN